MDAYHTLGIVRGCTRQEAKDAFRARAWHAHPDRGGDDQAFIEVYTAYKQILKELDRIPSQAAGRASRTPASSLATETTDASWAREVIVMEVPPTVPRSPTPPDPNWDPDLVLLDKPPRPLKPFDPRWNPDLVMLDEPPGPAWTTDQNSSAETFGSWLRDFSNRTDRANSSWPSARLRDILAAILLILVVVNFVLSAITWFTPEQ